MSNSYRDRFFDDLIRKTGNFGSVTWLGHPVWQNVLDLWVIQETISEVRPSLLIECGTNRGGSARFFAHLFDLLGHGEVVTVDITKMHDLSHPRIEFLLGSSLEGFIVDRVEQKVQEARAANGPVMVILDSDHSARHVQAEMETYGRFVSPGSFMLVQDGCIDTSEAFRDGRPGPLVAISEFLHQNAEFEVDKERCEKFLITHHPMGWLRRKQPSGSDATVLGLGAIR